MTKGVYKCPQPSVGAEGEKESKEEFDLMIKGVYKCVRPSAGAEGERKSQRRNLT